MERSKQVPEPVDPAPVAHRPGHAVEDIVASRAVATERIYRGGGLAVLGFGGALVVDWLGLRPGLPLWISLGATLTAFGAGAVWAGAGATHLIRHGRRGSFLWLASLTGLGGSVILNVASRYLSLAWYHPVLAAVNRFAMTAGVFFTAALMVLGILALVRRMMAGSGSDDGSE